MSIGQRTPGPIHHFVRFRSNPTAVYLGTAVAAPKPEQELFKLEVFNDLSGRSVPFQLVQDGEKWMIYTTLNRFDYNVVAAMRAVNSGQVPMSIPPNVLGSESGIARGTLSMGISDFELITVNGYYNTAAAGSFAGTPDLSFGRRFFYCNLRKYDEDTQGTRVLEVSMAIEAIGGFNLVTRGFDTYTENVNNAGPLATIV